MITKMLLLTVVMIFGYAVNCLAMHGHVKNNLSHTSKTFENAISNNNEALVKRLMDKVNRIEFDNRQLQGRVNGMESENKLRVERVVAKNRQLLERVNTLESDNRQLYELLNGIQSENRHLFERLDEMQSKNERADSMDSESKHLREQVRVMEFDIRRLLDKIAILDGREHKEIYGIKTETVKQNEHTDGLELLVKKQQVEIEQLKQMAQMSNENGSASIRTDMHFTMRNKRVIPVQKQGMLIFEP